MIKKTMIEDDLKSNLDFKLLKIFRCYVMARIFFPLLCVSDSSPQAAHVSLCYISLFHSFAHDVA